MGQTRHFILANASVLKIGQKFYMGTQCNVRMLTGLLDVPR